MMLETTTLIDTGPSRAARDVLKERFRQVTEEGWTAEHDDQHIKGELAGAAATYALGTARYRGLKIGWFFDAINVMWPFETKWFKPKGGRVDLVKAAALLIAEIERLDRAEARAAE